MAWPLSATSQTPQTFRPLLTLEQASPVGGGASLSADGETMVYAGSDNALHMLQIASREDHVLLKRIDPDLSFFSSPSFSPDGLRVVFGAGGGTSYYRSEIYSVWRDGTHLTRLTTSLERRNPDGKFSEFFYTPTYSPDGSQILVWHYSNDPRGSHTDSAELVSPTGSRLLRMIDGRPLCWSTTGDAIFVARGEHDQDGKGAIVVKVDLVTGTNEPVSRLNEPIFGKLPAADVFAIEDDLTVGFATVQGATASAPAPVQIPVRKRRDGAVATSHTGDMSLLSMHFDATATNVLLRYKGGTAETLEIFTVE
jgi:hypothetical protein